MKRKSIYSLLLVVCFVTSMLVLPVSAATESGSLGDNITWTFDSATATLTFSGTGILTGLPKESTEEYMKHRLDVHHLVIAEGITEIAAHSFGHVFYYVESIRIADSVHTIGDSALNTHRMLKQLHLGKGIKIIGADAFSYSEKLESLILPAGIQSIGAEAFSLSGIKELVIPEGITVIEGGAFRASENLTRVVIPTSVTLIKNGAFRDCVNLKDIYYAGTEAQWKAIDLKHSDEIVGDATTGGNTPLVEGTIHYNHTHSYTEEKVIVAASCIKEGESLRTCECGATEIWKGKSSEHAWDAGRKNADTTVTYQCTLCDAVKTEGTPVTEPPATTPPATEPPATEPPATEPLTTEPLSTEPTSTEPETTTAPTEPSDEAPTVGSGDVTPEQPKKFPWVAVSIGAAVLLAAAGVVIWLRVRKKE